MKEKTAFNFLVERLFFRARELFSPPGRKVAEANIRKGFRVLDFGCGIGSHSIAASETVGPDGRIFAVDCQPAAVKYVKKRASRKGLENTNVILTDCDTGIESASVDTVLLYDVFHNLQEPGQVLSELARVLKSEGTLSFSDHHMKREKIIESLTSENKFGLDNEGCLTFNFKKIGELT